MPYDIGDTVTRTLTTSTAPSGTPSVVVTKPDGTTAATPTVTGSGTSWSFNIAVDSYGPWIATWTAPGLGTEPDGWYVQPNQTIATALIPVVTVSQAREFLRATTGSIAETALLARLCKAATLAADAHVRLARQVTETHRANPSGVLVLDRRPVQSLISVTALDGAEVLTLGDLAVDPQAWDVSRTLGISGRYRVVYVGGNYPNDAIEQGALEWVLHRWRASQAHSSATYGDGGLITDFDGLPNSVKQCWGPYLDLASIA